MLLSSRSQYTGIQQFYVDSFNIVSYVWSCVGGAVVSRLVRSLGFEPWPATLCCVLGQDT